MDIHLHIERLVVDGMELGPHDRRALKAALEAELSQVLSSQGWGDGAPTGGARPSAPAQPIQMEPEADAGRLGRQIARSVYGALVR